MEENGISHMDDHVVTLEEYLSIMQQKNMDKEASQ
jgi:hypothetical protein